MIFITGSYGLGENAVQDKVDPDEFFVHKPTFRQAHRAVLQRTLGGKRRTMLLAPGQFGPSTAQEETRPELRACFCLTDSEVLTLADYAIRIEDRYSATAGFAEPMDIEWAKDAVDGKLYIVQARPDDAERGHRACAHVECAAVRRVREDMGLAYLVVMVPFCRRVEEAKTIAP